MRAIIASPKVSRFLISGLGALLLPVVSAHALDVPARKPGLWEISLKFPSGRATGHTMTSQHCIDAETDKQMNAMAGGRADMCSKMNMQKTPTGYTFESVCNLGTGNATSSGTITGSFDSAYVVDVTTRHEGGPPVPGMPAESHIQISAKWTGACKPGQQPGDMIMANGMKINIKNMPHMNAPK